VAQTLSPKVVESLKLMTEFPERFGDIAEFASLCAYLCENAYINGECLVWMLRPGCAREIAQRPGLRLFWTAPACALV
jgi:NAD(P)-dependent dehydrogenase (short-subunit alcohol dehydrogenase family)